MKVHALTRNRPQILDSRGFTLVELIVVMGMFVIIIMVAAGAFEKITTDASREVKSAESNVQGIVGLEMMRSDIEHAGFGLPYSLEFTAEFDESQVESDYLAKGIDPKIFNDKNNTSGDSSKVPRAVQSAAATGGTAAAYELGRDYLVIKSTFVGLNSVAKKWSYIEGVGATSGIKLWGKEDFVENDQVVVLNATTRALIGADISNFSFTVPALASGKYTPPSAYQPSHDYDNYLIYGLRSKGTGNSVNPAFPYNRVDYYIKRPSSSSDISSRCAPNTGILYKGILNHSSDVNSRGVTQYPLLDCVADMQVVYSLDTNEDGGVDLHSNQDLSGLTAEQIRTQVKEIRVYILTHDGGKDKNYTYPSSTITVGDYGAGRNFDLTALSTTEWRNYRWKIYSLVVVPKNIKW